VISAAALVAYLLGLGLAFGVRSLVQARRTGDAGWRSPGGKPGSPQWWTRIATGFGSLAAGLAAPVADLAGLRRVAVLDHTALRIAGLALTLAAITGVYLAQNAMGASWRIGVHETERTALVTGGPFSLVRNPIFTGMMAFAAGLFLAVPNPIAAAGLVLVIVGVELQVRRVEEPYLRQAHGELYRDYTARVGRFLPGIGRSRHRLDSSEVDGRW
jgi:protein-S-isoprenylcysteine O-methyltransferase Ste14